VRGEAFEPNPLDPTGGSTVHQHLFDWSPIVFDHHKRLVEAETLRRLAGAEAARRSVRPSRLPAWLATLPLALLVVLFVFASARVHGTLDVASADGHQVARSPVSSNTYIGSPS